MPVSTGPQIRYKWRLPTQQKATCRKKHYEDFRKLFMTITIKKGRPDSTGQHHPSLQETEVGSLCVQGLPKLQGKFKGSLDTEVRACLKVKRSGQ